MHTRIGNVILVGTSHISQDSVQEVRQVVATYQPHGIAVELDPVRLQSLFSKQRSRFTLRFGIGVGIFMFIASLIQQGLGKYVKLQPGSDMKEGVLQAKQYNIPLFCVDQHIYITMKKLNKVLTFRFFLRLLKDAFTKKNGMAIRINLKKVPTQRVIEQAMHVMQQQYPQLYDILVEQRNKVMVKHIQHIMQKQTQDFVLVVIIGAAHLKGMKALLEQPIHSSV
ncbi:MAG: TraB domain-containing protein [Candidatus Woesearchaeota archaeon]